MFGLSVHYYLVPELAADVLLDSPVVLQGHLLLVLLPGLLQRQQRPEKQLGPVPAPPLHQSPPLGQGEAVPVPASLMLILQHGNKAHAHSASAHHNTMHLSGLAMGLRNTYTHPRDELFAKA